jgi:hypothetical protein
MEFSFRFPYDGSMAIETVIEPATDEKTKLFPMVRVLVHNDDVTPMGFVLYVLGEVFNLDYSRAHTRRASPSWWSSPSSARSYTSNRAAPSRVPAAFPCRSRSSPKTNPVRI